VERQTRVPGLAGTFLFDLYVFSQLFGQQTLMP
jgi:hypothetical protein